MSDEGSQVPVCVVRTARRGRNELGVATQITERLDTRTINREMRGERVAVGPSRLKLRCVEQHKFERQVLSRVRERWRLPAKGFVLRRGQKLIEVASKRWIVTP